MKDDVVAVDNFLAWWL